jgi:single-strand DNA-binding protein
MASENTVTLVGNITDDPELRYTPSGAAVANFTVAVNRRQRNGDQWEDKLEGFFRCTCWRDMAENISESLTKGMRVMVVGRLQESRWEDQDGGKRSRIEIQVDEVGPSLRWATASVTRSNRSGGGGGGFGGGQAPARQGNQGGGAFAAPAPQAAPQPASGGFGDEDWGSSTGVGGTGNEGEF